ncbi:MAG TPA: HdeA/HdeB family chaperone [Candidatus Binatus sp.]|nr:HdeA/HdeB family chaperone [Candidatus Binatus sp.]
MVIRLSSLALALFITIGPAAATATTAPAPTPKSTIISIEKVTCGDMLASNALDRSSIMMFYWGYLAGKTGMTTLNSGGLELATSRVMEKCMANKSMTVLAAIDATKHGTK